MNKLRDEVGLSTVISPRIIPFAVLNLSIRSEIDFRPWTNVNSHDNRNYLRNAYRVLLTRARQGMVVFVPPGDSIDPTRSASYYDPTFHYLAELGLPVLDS